MIYANHQEQSHKSHGRRRGSETNDAENGVATGKALQQKCLPKLDIGDTVYVQLKPNKRKWTPGIIIHTGLENLRTYSVQTKHGGWYIRNRKFFRVRHTNNQQHTT